MSEVAVSEQVEAPTQLRRADVVFDGGAGDLFVTQLLAMFITSLSFGILFPWAICMLEKWKVDHTVVDGVRLEFRGAAMGLFGSWIKWWFLSVITFGIYSFWVIPALNKWKADNTYLRK